MLDAVTPFLRSADFGKQKHAVLTPPCSYGDGVRARRLVDRAERRAERCVQPLSSDSSGQQRLFELAPCPESEIGEGGFHWFSRRGL
ncbi:hypothetical protein AOLI_G00033870 [Acnodon oligacanthus]